MATAQRQKTMMMMIAKITTTTIRTVTVESDSKDRPLSSSGNTDDGVADVVNVVVSRKLSATI